jgi:hypothetical protein
MSGTRFSWRSALRWTPLFLVIALAVGPAAVTSSSPAPFVVHEWGTFVAMEGSDGLALEGLHHDEDDLPPFVHSRSRDQLRLHATSSKLETPVIYFYPSGSQRPRYVNVRVDFPEGIITQWYPQAWQSSPRLLQGDPVPPLKGGYMEWSGELTPDPSGSAARSVVTSLTPRTEPGHHWNFARDTRAALLTTNTWDWATGKTTREQEKFIFYRGLGRFVPPLRVQTAAEGRLTLANAGAEPLEHLFVLRVEGGRGVFQYLPSLGVGAEKRLQIAMSGEAAPLEEFVGKIGRAVGERLVEQGLFPDEAQAMVNTWSRSYFRTEGIRVLYLVPRAQIDRTLPLKITAQLANGGAAPTQVERVFVGRVECLTPEQEQKIEGWLRDLAASDADRATAARAGLLALGRFAEPHLRRAVQNSSDPAVRAQAQALLLSDALSELIAAEKEFPSDLDVTARLAALQRRAGQNPEATAKGEAVLARLQAKAPAKTDHVGQRKWLRSLAFAREAIGEPSAAADAYGEWVSFAATLKKQECQNCHKDTRVKPLSYADLRDWWGGERFREMATAAGKTEALIAAAEGKLKASPADPGALVTLAYLLPGRGENEAADRAWAKLGVDIAKP